MNENDMALETPASPPDPSPMPPVSSPSIPSTPPPAAVLPTKNPPEKIARDFIEDARKKCLQGDYDGALEDCIQAIEINPFYSRAHRQHGLVLYLKDRLDDAEVAWKKAWECDCRR